MDRASRPDSMRMPFQDQLSQHAIEIDRLAVKISSIEREQGAIGTMLENISRIQEHIASHLAALDAKMTQHFAEVDRRFTEQRMAIGDACVVRHEQVDRRFSALERQDEKTSEQIQTMGEITKVRYIKQLQAELRKNESSTRNIEKQKYGWKRYIASAIVGFVSAVILAYLSSRFGWK